jgi:hypothetical protein
MENLLLGYSREYILFKQKNIFLKSRNYIIVCCIFMSPAFYFELIECLGFRFK